MKNTYEGGGGRVFNLFPGIFLSLGEHIILAGSCLRSRKILIARNCLPKKSRLLQYTAAVTLFNKEICLSMST